jgi:integrase
MAPRIIGRLKPREVATARPPAGRTSAMLCDGGGLYLQLTTGEQGHVRRSWAFRYQLTNILTKAQHRHELGLGSLATIGLAKARLKARALREQLADGLDPKTEKVAARQALLARKAKAISFEEVALMYYRLHADGWGREHREQWINSLRRYAFPALGRLAPADVDSGAILKIIEPLWGEKTVTAGRVLNRIEAVFDYCATAGLRSGDNPARGVRAALPKQSRVAKVEHFTALPYAEVGALMRKLADDNTLAAAALQLVILTASRPDEVCLAMWPEIDLTQRLWVIPAERMKSRREHRIPLSDAAIKVLRALPRSEIDQRIFPVSKHALLRVLRNYANAHTHGFRGSFRTWCSGRTNFPDKIVEAALAHRVGDNKTQQAYERGDLLDRRRRLMRDWARFLSVPATAGAVVPLRKAEVDA